MNLVYKKIPPEEFLLYRKLRLESLKLHPNVFEANFNEEQKKSELMFESLIKTEDSTKFVVGAFSGDFLVGICGFVNGNHYSLVRTGTIIQMYVKEKYRGNDIGLCVTKKIIEAALRVPEIDSILLEVKKTNAPAVSIYTRAGFKKANIGNDPEILYMVLQLD